MNKLTWVIIIISFIIFGLLVNFYSQKDNSKLQVITIPKETLINSKKELVLIRPSVRFEVHTLPHLLSKSNCISLCQDALPYLSASKIYNVDQEYQHLIRSSTSCSIVSSESEKVRLMASKLSGYPLSNVENAQVVRYEEGEGFDDHYDTDPTNKNNPSWSRIATFMIFLNLEWLWNEPMCL